MCSAFGIIACTGTEKPSDNEFLIRGRISGLEDGSIIGLGRMDGHEVRVAPTDTVRNGRFTIRREAFSENPEWWLMVLFMDGVPVTSSGVWVAPGATIRVRGEGKLLPTWRIRSSITYQREENRYKNKSRDLIAEDTRIRLEINELRRNRENFSPDNYRQITDSLGLIRSWLSLKRASNDINIIEKTDISPVWLDRMRWLALILTSENVGDSELAGEIRGRAFTQYRRMSEDDKDTFLGNQIARFLNPPTVIGVGEYMADSELFDIHGNVKRISDYSGKYLLLSFWSRGCAPCIAAFPELREVAEIYQNKLTVISISLDTETAWKRAMDTYDISWINLRDPSSSAGLAANYNIPGTPSFVMISPENKIIDKWAGFRSGSIKSKISENIR
jgi:peroxiredoxin